MGTHCLIFNCHNGASKREDLKMFRVPKYSPKRNATEAVKDKRRKRHLKWINAIKREDLTDTLLENGRICSDHFVTGILSTCYIVCLYYCLI